MKEIYKLDNKGKIRVFSAQAVGDTLILGSGVLGGKITFKERKCKPKNIGKVNATTAWEQAELEAERAYVKKLSIDYFETEHEALTTLIELPMTALNYKNKYKHVKFPCHVQPKLDGMRAINLDKGKTSRENNVIDTLPHIEEELKRLKSENVHFKVDGELYAHGYSFEDNMKLIKKHSAESIKVKYHVYDIALDLPFEQRYDILSSMIHGFKHIELVPTYVVHSEDEMKKAHEMFLRDGYEGTMIRHGNTPYEFHKKSISLLKYKDMRDIALPILDIVPEDKNPELGKAIFEWEGAKDGILKSGSKMSHAMRRKLLRDKDKYVGKTAELRFFEYSDKGVPRFPVMYGIRLDK